MRPTLSPAGDIPHVWPVRGPCVAGGTGHDRGVTVGAVLFDMDGTLIESEGLWAISLQQLAAEHGGVLSEPARLSMVGTDMVASMAIFRADLGLPDLDFVTSTDRLVELTETLFAAGLPWRPGALN